MAAFSRASISPTARANGRAAATAAVNSFCCRIRTCCWWFRRKASWRWSVRHPTSSPRWHGSPRSKARHGTTRSWSGTSCWCATTRTWPPTSCRGSCADGRAVRGRPGCCQAKSRSTLSCGCIRGGNRDGNVAPRGRDISADVGGQDAEDVIAGGEAARIPPAGRCHAVVKCIRHDVQKSRAPLAVERNAAASRIHHPDDRRIRAHAIEPQRVIRLFESGGRCAAPLQHLVPEIVDPQSPPGPVLVGGVPRVDNDLYSISKNEPSSPPLGNAHPLFVLQTNIRDRRRNVILELHEAERERVQLLAWPPDVQVNVIERIDGANCLAGGEARSALDPHGGQRAVRIVYGRESGIRKGLARFQSSDADVNIRESADAKRLGQCAVSIHGVHRGHDTITDRRDEGAFISTNVDPRMKPFGPFHAARLADRASDLERPFHRCDRPEQR